MNTYNIIEKAYEINFNKISDGFLSDIKWCHAENRNKAKKKLLDEVYFDNWKLKYSDKPIDYLTIPIIRCKELDLIDFEGKQINRCKIDIIINERKRESELDDILNNPKIKFCYIVKSGFYYRPNSCGYTESRYEAGVYKKEDAVNEAKYCDELSIIPIDIENHNKMINEKIEILQKKLINVL